MVGQDVSGHVKPELGHLSKHRPLLRDLIFQNHIKTTDPVRSHHNQGIPIVIDLTYFSFLYRFQLLHFLSPPVLNCMFPVGNIPLLYYIPILTALSLFDNNLIFKAIAKILPPVGKYISERPISLSHALLQSGIYHPQFL